MKAGFSNLNISLLDKVSPTLVVTTDGAFSQNTSTTNFNIGSGIFYYTNNYSICFKKVDNLLLFYIYLLN